MILKVSLPKEALIEKHNDELGVKIMGTIFCVISASNIKLDSNENANLVLVLYKLKIYLNYL